ncbi:MAG: DUF4162 domain-containing protein, partial [Bacteroidales bacterium]|nr:DUF4162 domain-containing protein [Bacteroidales bacterium]
ITTVIHKPSLLILDEPFSGFDPVNVQIVRNEILDMKDKGTTIILSTHNMESVEELCDNIALINKSKLVITGGVEEIRRNHGRNEVELIYRSADRVDLNNGSLYNVLTEEETRYGRRVVVETARDAASREILMSLASKVDIVSYRELIPRMNDIFIKLVSE